MPTDRAHSAIEILLVEDSSDDADLMIEALKEGCLDCHITVAGNGEDALASLRKKGIYAASATMAARASRDLRQHFPVP